jgi:hypothetical protein
MRFVSGDATNELPEALSAPTVPVPLPAQVPAAEPAAEPAGMPAAVPSAVPAAVPGPAPAADDDAGLWITEEVPRDSWPTPPMRVGRPRGGQRERTGPVRKPPAVPRRPRVGLAALVALALVGSFFAWVTAEPLWLSVGRGDTGVATVARCTGTGVAQRCGGDFASADGTYVTEGVRLLGVTADRRTEGTELPARMVGADSGTAYVGSGAVMTLRWALGLVLVLACGAGIVWATGALRLEDRRSRRRAALAGFFAPLLVTIGFLAATF